MASKERKVTRLIAYDIRDLKKQGYKAKEIRTLIQQSYRVDLALTSIYDYWNESYDDVLKRKQTYRRREDVKKKASVVQREVRRQAREYQVAKEHVSDFLEELFDGETHLSYDEIWSRAAKVRHNPGTLKLFETLTSDFLEKTQPGSDVYRLRKVD